MHALLHARMRKGGGISTLSADDVTDRSAVGCVRRAAADEDQALLLSPQTNHLT